MSYRLHERVTAVETPPIALAQSWLDESRFDSNTPLIDLSQAVPNYAPPQAIQQTISDLGQDFSTGFYTDILGIKPLRDAIAEEMAGSDGHVSARNVAVTAGCNQAFSVVMQALLAPGDEVILPLPWYFNHRMYLDMLGAKAIGINNVGDADSIAVIERNLTARTKAIMLVSPNNPTGRIYSPDFVAALKSLASKHALALVIDETYRDFIADPGSKHKLLEEPDWHDSFVQLYSFSKSFGMTGYRVGSVVASPHLIEQIMKILDCQTICAAAISQRAALTGLQQCDDFRRQKRDLMQSRLIAVRDAFKRPGLDFKLLSSGAYFAYVQHPFQQTSMQVAEKLAREHNILTLPGSMFGPEQESALRLAFANIETERFDSAIDRLQQASQSMF